MYFRFTDRKDKGEQTTARIVDQDDCLDSKLLITFALMGKSGSSLPGRSSFFELVSEADSKSKAVRAA